ncbi:hypothetical protein SteCoe_1659 [Stentor coeruleus]|uniref:Uncharacterized protein n=1 Tax=Stentor coeruleus TaxID=5963 RepID=A0A1R2D1M3_9CILI|nr:hypothetical protein SteCoe_1659 [Stentor coeruleus]
MISGMELDLQQELQNHDTLSEKQWEMDLDEAFQEDKTLASFPKIWISNKKISENKETTPSLEIVLSPDLLHRYYSYILYNTSRLFPMNSSSSQKKNLLMLEAPKIDEPNWQNEPFYTSLKDYPSELSFLPMKRQSKSCSYPKKFQKLSYYNDIYSF